MKFTFKKRACSFGTFNNRFENNGPDAKVKAIDLPFRIPLKPKELDMLVPSQGVPLSTFLYGEDLRKPQLQTPLLSPIRVYRKPEHIQITIYDNPIDKRQKLVFDDSRVKDPTIELDPDGKSSFLTGKFQIHPNGVLQRIADKIEGQTLEFECKETQPELFDEPSEEEEEDGGEQQQLMDSPDEDEDED